LPERYIGRSLGRFRIESLVGSGGFAWVYRGYDPELDIPVAIKVLKPQYAGDETFESRFRREASMAAKLRHPHIIRILAVGREADAVYFVMDYLPNSLVERLKAMPTMPESFTVRLGTEVALALGFAHREGVIHRDIKADNILFDAHGNAVVADFGIARAVSGYVQETGTNMVVGTPQYFSPEQARGLQLDGRADIYSLGVTLYRVATGTLPFDGQDWYEIARQHVEDRPRKPRSLNPEVSPELERIILRCLAKDPGERFESGEALAEELAVLAPHTTDPSAARTLQVSRITPQRGASALWSRMAHSHWVRRGVLALGFSAVAVALGFAVIRDLPRQTPNAIADTTRTPADTFPLAMPPIQAAVPDSPGVEPQSEPTLGTVRVTVPDDARVDLDGVERGRGSVRLTNVQPGSHRITARLPGAVGCDAATVTRTITIASGRTDTVNLEPRRCGALAFVRITPSSAAYTLQSGDGPTVTGIVDQRPTLQLVPGTYRLRLRADGCLDYEATVEIREGETREHFATMACEATPADSGA
jgi:serine/threonine-protein kinase